MDKNRSVKIYGLIGYPVKHSLSPAMHNAAFRALKINAEYKLFEVKAQELERFLQSLSEKNIYGLNVTIPYKEKVMPFLEKISKEAQLIAAVNTIKVSNNRLEGFNTDGEGFLKHLSEDLHFSPESKIIAIIGAGGAAKAVSVYIGKIKPKRISIYDIDKAKLSALLSHLKENFHDIEFKRANSIEELSIQESDLLVNAAPIGMKETDPCLVGEKFIHKNLLVYDLIYNPKETKLLKIAREKGARTSNGLGMLLYQGILSFELWTGEKAPHEIMQEALNEGAEKLC
jgi:shikimate dehydrogenase